MNAEVRIERIADVTPPGLLADAAALDGWVTSVVLREITDYKIILEPKGDEPVTVEARPA